jgi:UDP-N-acetylglucosamine 2-epimerase (non-hydrolysing)/GDP/UDP-N,N'-diacetylbacillosamine 2-epimerase (hydrolysing)
VGIIITKPNADTDGRVLIEMIDDFVSKRSNAKGYTSLGQARYLSTMAVVDAVVGNSSSGLYEAPSFKKPTVNIGDRQKGRLQASSVINCEPYATDIEHAIQKAFAMDCSDAVNPYGNGDSVQKMISIMKSITDYRALLKKHFHKAGS